MIKRLRCHSDSRFRIAFGQLSGLCWPCLHTLIAGQWRGRAATRQEILGRFQIGYFSLAKTRPQAPSHHNQGNLIICYAAHNFTCKRNNQPTNQPVNQSVRKSWGVTTAIFFWQPRKLQFDTKIMPCAYRNKKKDILWE